MKVVKRLFLFTLIVGFFCGIMPSGISYATSIKPNINVAPNVAPELEMEPEYK